MEKSKKCPFNIEVCSPECGLYIDPQDLNETVRNKLASIGVLERKTGICAIKHLSLCLGRHIFENAAGYLR